MSKSLDLFSATDELAQILGPELAKAFTDHRKALKKPMTAFAGQLMAKKLRTFPDPVAAVEQAILKGWSDVYPVEPERRAEPRGIDAMEDDLRRRVDEYQNGRAGRDASERKSGAGAVPALPFDGWKGQSRPH